MNGVVASKIILVILLCTCGLVERIRIIYNYVSKGDEMGGP